MNVNNSAYNFKSKVFMPEEFEGTGDPMVAQGNMLTNIFNRLIRSVLYTIQSNFDGIVPKIEPSQTVIEEANTVAKQYEEKAFNFKFNEIILLLDEYFRKANQDWAVRSKSQDNNVKAQLIADTIHIIKTGVTLLHPIAPNGVDLIVKYFKMDEQVYNWDNVSKTYSQMYKDVKSFEFLPPKFDFFKKHSSQL